METKSSMNRYLGLLIGSLLLLAGPMAFAQGGSDHVEVGVFADYFRYGDNPHINFIGLGGRAGFNVRPSIQLEAEMAYDFRRNFTNTFENGASTVFVKSNFRTLHGFFGPKLQTGSGPFRVFVGVKFGFDNFSVNTQVPGQGFVSAVGLTNGKTDFALYPSGGFEAFAGPIGIRAEVGDDVFFDHGGHNNLRATVGPQFRF
jgi:hypothetical protein